MLSIVDKATDVGAKLPAALEDFKKHMNQPAASGEPLNTFHIAFKGEDTIADSESYAQNAEIVLKDNKAMLSELGVLHVNYIVPQGTKSTRYFNFLSCNDYSEVLLHRNMLSVCVCVLVCVYVYFLPCACVRGMHGSL